MPHAPAPRRRAVVAVIGPGASEPLLDAAAERVGALLAEAGVVVACGGLGGVMQAACRGASGSGGSTVGILPGADPAAANPYVEIAVPTGLGEARNLLVVRSGRAIVAVGGGFGTLSELAFARKLGVPVFGLHTWRLPDDGITHVASAEAAAAAAIAVCHRDG